MAQELNTAEAVVEYIGVTASAMEKAAAAQAAAEAQRQKIAALIPAVVEALAANERIRPEAKEACAKALADPFQTMELMLKLASHRNAAELATLGSPTQSATTKRASHDPASSLTSPFVGAKDGGLKESDIRIWRGLGLTPPAN